VTPGTRRPASLTQADAGSRALPFPTQDVAGCPARPRGGARVGHPSGRRCGWRDGSSRRPFDWRGPGPGRGRILVHSGPRSKADGKEHRADPELVAVMQLDLAGYGLAVQESAVATEEVADKGLAILVYDSAVVSADRRAGRPKVAEGVAAQAEGGPAYVQYLALLRPRQNDQTESHNALAAQAQLAPSLGQLLTKLSAYQGAKRAPFFLVGPGRECRGVSPGRPAAIHA
jgi:hypothetical protein